MSKNIKIVEKRKQNDFKQQKNFVNKFTITKKLSLVIPFLLLTLVFLVIPIFVIIYFSLAPTSFPAKENWGILTGTIWIKIGKSFYISIVTMIICLIIGFPFTYFLVFSKSKIWKISIFTLITTPVWINILVKLIGLKTIFDIMGGQINSTYGDIFTIIGLVYLYLPFVMMPLYNSLEIMPKNLINASYDLGRNKIYTFFFIIIPWTKSALISSIILVLLPAFTTVAVPSFLNNRNDSGLIGDVIVDIGSDGLSNNIALARTSVLALVVSLFMFIMYGMIVFFPKIIFIIQRKIKNAKK